MNSQYNTPGLGGDNLQPTVPDMNKEEQQHIKITPAIILVVTAMVVSQSVSQSVCQSADGN